MLESLWKLALSLFLYVHLDNSKRIWIQSDYDTQDPWLLVFICRHCLVFINLRGKVVSRGNQQLITGILSFNNTQVNSIYDTESEKLNKAIAIPENIHPYPVELGNFKGVGKKSFSKDSL